MSKGGNPEEDFWKSYKKLGGYLNKTADKVVEEADQDLKKITDETKQIADKVKDEYRNNYEDMERKAINGMKVVYDQAKIELMELKKEAQGEPSISPELQKKVEEVRQKANDSLEMIRRESEKSFEDRAKAQLKEVCPESTTSEEYYKCTLREAYQKASVLFDEQRRQFARESDKTYSGIMKGIDKSYSSIKSSSKKSSSTNDDQATSGHSKKGSRS